MLRCLLLVLLTADRGQYGEPWLVSAASQQTAMLCVFSKPALTSELQKSILGRHLDQTAQASLHSPCESVRLCHHDPVAGSPLFLSWTTLDRYYSFGDSLTWSSSHHSLAHVKITQILMHAHFSCFYHQLRGLKCPLAPEYIPPTKKSWRDNWCYSLHQWS